MAEDPHSADSRPTLKQGASGSIVRELQTKLGLRPEDVDGVFGARTEAALRQFQRESGLVPDGIAGPQTWAVLANKPPVASAAKTSGELVEKIARLAADSAIARYPWRDRGLAPMGYIKGMVLVFARVCCKFKLGDAAAIDMAQADRDDPDHDALTWYRELFAAAGMSNNTMGPDTLRHLYVLLIGLGMRESSGKYCEGRDRSASNTTAETAEAGLFQTSFNARSASPLLPRIFAEYSANPSGFLDVFREGVRCSSESLENFGSGEGREFQRLSKECPAFAAEFAAVALRHIRTHWGPINRRNAEIRPECDDLLRRVQSLVDTSPDATAVLV